VEKMGTDHQAYDRDEDDFHKYTLLELQNGTGSGSSV
jgi:hypothetical protein